MRVFDELTPSEQVEAEDIALTALLGVVVEGGIRFNDELNHDNLQARIDAALEKADEMQTPWFAHEYVLDTCRDDLEGMARADAEDALYLDTSEHIIRL